MPHFVYMLECYDGTLYVGSTHDVEKRLYAHNHLKSGAKYTRGRRPVKLVHKEKFPTITLALQREYALKQLTRDEKLELVKRQQKRKTVD